MTGEKDEKERQKNTGAHRRAGELLRKYKAGKSNLEARIISNEQWYKLQHWDELRVRKAPGEPEPASAWLFNCLTNKHADAMDSFPEAVVLPREQSDEKTASVLTSILPMILNENDYEQVYSDMWWYKLKTGTGVTGVFWNKRKQNGLGDIDIRTVDLLNLFWEPGIKDIQKSPNLFHVELADREKVLSEYPFAQEALSSPAVDVGRYVYEDSVDTSDKCAVVDWYYKVNRQGRQVLHFCKFVNDTVLYASENDAYYAERGFYDHGQYPFVFDPLFPEEGTPCGFGYIDVCKSPQAYIDSLDRAIQKYAVMAANPRFFVRADGCVNEDEFADWQKTFIHYQGNGDPNASIMPLTFPQLSNIYVTIRQLKVDELKETTGNRDFSQGGTMGGVTAASAIAALQEAGSKHSRDMLKGAYRAFKKLMLLVIEVMRQFYSEPRYFRIMEPNGTLKFERFDNSALAAGEQGSDFALEMGLREPVFDVEIRAQKTPAFSTLAENERAKELYALGFFRPETAEQALKALDMMQFEGIEKVRRELAKSAEKQAKSAAAPGDAIAAAGGAVPGGAMPAFPGLPGAQPISNAANALKNSLPGFAAAAGIRGAVKG